MVLEYFRDGRWECKRTGIHEVEQLLKIEIPIAKIKKSLAIIWRQKKLLSTYRQQICEQLGFMNPPSLIQVWFYKIYKKIKFPIQTTSQAWVWWITLWFTLFVACFFTFIFHNCEYVVVKNEAYYVLFIVYSL